MMRTSISRKTATVFAIAASAGALMLCGCSGIFEDQIVALRNSQADAALQSQNVAEAEKEYGLALALAPNDEHARTGLAQSLYLHAKANLAAGDIDEAYIEVQKALKYAPKDAAVLDLASAVDDAKIRRDIVVSNFPSFKSSSDAISALLKANGQANKDIQLQLHDFHIDFDTAHLAKAIAQSYDLEEEQHRVTQRLIAYKGQVESGAPGQARAQPQVETPGLLPIP
jgi:tetratricopeptide (TPR) repeat protein